MQCNGKAVQGWSSGYQLLFRVEKCHFGGCQVAGDQPHRVARGT